MAQSRNSFLDNKNFKRITKSQRDKIEEKREKSGFSGGGSSSDPITKNAEPQITVDKAILENGRITTKSIIVNSESAKQSIIDQNRELQRRQAANQREQALEERKSESVRQLKERQRAAQEAQAQELAAPTPTISNRRIDAAPDPTTLSGRLQRFSQQNDFTQTGPVSTALGVFAGGTGIIEGTISAIKNPVDAGRGAVRTAKQAATGGFPEIGATLRNPSRGGDFLAGEIAANIAAVAVTPTIARRIAGSRTPTVQAATRGLGRSTRLDDLTISTADLETVAVVDDAKVFRAKTKVAGVEKPLDTGLTTRETATRSTVERVNNVGKAKRQAQTVETATVELVFDDAAAGTTKSTGLRVTRADDISRTERVASVSKQVTDEFSTAGSVSKGNKGVAEVSASGSKDVLSGDLPFRTTLDGVTIETLAPTRISELRSGTLGGAKAKSFIDAFEDVAVDVVKQAKGRVPKKGIENTVSASQKTKTAFSERTTALLEEAGKVNIDVVESVKKTVQKERAASATKKGRVASAAPTLNVPQSLNNPFASTVTGESIVFEDTKKSVPLTFNTPSGRSSPPRSVLESTRTPILDVTIDSRVSASTRSRSKAKVRQGTSQRPDSGIKQFQGSPQDTISLQDTDTKPKQRQAQDTKPLQRQELRSTSIPEVPFINNQSIIRVPPALPIGRGSEVGARRSRFLVVVGKKGNKVFQDLGVGGLDLVRRARDIVKGGAAASFTAIPINSRDTGDVRDSLGSSFRRSKKDPFRFVQKREDRISSRGEKGEITELGISANRKRSRQNSNLLSSKKKTSKALKLVESGTPLRQARNIVGRLRF